MRDRKFCAYFDAVASVSQQTPTKHNILNQGLTNDQTSFEVEPSRQLLGTFARVLSVVVHFPRQHLAPAPRVHNQLDKMPIRVRSHQQPQAEKRRTLPLPVGVSGMVDTAGIHPLVAQV